MTAAGPQHSIWYLKKISPFSHLPRTQLLRLQRKLKPMHAEAGQEIYPVGRATTSVFLIRRGAVEVARLGPKGRKVGLAVMGPGEVFGFLGLLERREWPHVAMALEACELWRVPAREFRRLTRRHPGFTAEVARTLSGKALLFSAKIESLLFKPIPARLAEVLAGLTVRLGTRANGGWQLGIPLTQQNLADLIGASRQHVSSALARLAAQGLIRRRRGRQGGYEIPDINALQNASERL
jgi:CRP-like cAMP-binding protein